MSPRRRRRDDPRRTPEAAAAAQTEARERHDAHVLHRLDRELEPDTSQEQEAEQP